MIVARGTKNPKLHTLVPSVFPPANRYTEYVARSSRDGLSPESCHPADIFTVPPDALRDVPAAGEVNLTSPNTRGAIRARTGKY